MNQENSSNTFRVVAGGLLLYISYKMIQSLRAGEAGNEVVIISATVLFIITGIGIMCLGIKGMIKQNQMSEGEVVDENLNEELEAEEELYDEYVEPGLTKGKMTGIEQELDKLKDKDAKDIIDSE